MCIRDRLIVNPNARNTAKIGMGNDMFRKGSIHYVGSEIRAVILNKMMVDTQDDVCVIGGESIAIETALIAAEGTVVAVEYNGADRDTMEDNVDHFGLQNVTIIDRVDEESMKDCPVPVSYTHLHLCHVNRNTWQHSNCLL